MINIFIRYRIENKNHVVYLRKMYYAMTQDYKFVFCKKYGLISIANLNFKDVNYVIRKYCVFRHKRELTKMLKQHNLEYNKNPKHILD